MKRILQKLFGTKHERDIRTLKPLVSRINELDESYKSLSDSELRNKTTEFKDRLAHDESLDSIMCEAFAVVKNACRRLVGTKYQVCNHEVVWDMVPFDVQLMGAIVLHQGKIAEMATGEGKTLVATMPLYLNCLTGKNVHLVTVNDYLARRDAQWMGLLYEYLGVTVGCIQEQMTSEQRRVEYAKDITYGTNSQFGFDYLRDNGLAYLPQEQVQRGHYYAIVDEVDSILIDEARTPLIISGPVTTASKQYYTELKPRVEELVRKQKTLCNKLVQEAKELLEQGKTETAQLKLYQVYHGMPKHKQLMHMLEDTNIRKLHEQIENLMLTDMRKEQARALKEELYFTIDERGHEATLTEKGCESMNPTDPEAYVLPDIVSAMSEIDGNTSLSPREKAKRKQEVQSTFAEKSEKIHAVDQLIRAYCLYEKDVEYVVQNNQVLIVDEFTGRILPGRRWSDGLHQAIEAKEEVQIEGETQTLATITIQNYFRMYEKLAGMTGTAETEAAEFRDIYKLDVVVIPTNRPIRRIDANDVIFRTKREKFKAIIDEVVECYKRGQPVLIGTISVETSELLSRMLQRENIPHNVLNAKQHEREAEIVARAGQKGAITIATNMAGRGTDIKLGEDVVWLDRQIIESNITLDNYVDGKRLREQLLEKPCGLYVIGSERHEARRIDRQLRGRCARQGDPGMSRFYVSLEDDLMRLFGSDRISGVLSKMGMVEGQPLEHKWLNRSIENAQKRVEQHNYSIRRRTLQYDDVMNKQRELIYKFRGEIVRSDNVRERIYDIFYEVLLSQAEALLNPKDEKPINAYLEWVQTTFPVVLNVSEISSSIDNPEEVAKIVSEKVKHAYEIKVEVEDPNLLNFLEKQIILQAIDSHWQEYLRAMDALREGVGLRAYGQQDPLIEYKREAFRMFEDLMSSIKTDIISGVFRSATSMKSFQSFIATIYQNISTDKTSSAEKNNIKQTISGQRSKDSLTYREITTQTAASSAVLRRASQTTTKVGRNDPCPCGSGKKYKKCCGK